VLDARVLRLVASTPIAVTEHQNPSSPQNHPWPLSHRWPIDLRVGGLFAAFWAIYLARCAVTGDPMIETAEPLHAVIGGILFYGHQARFVFLVEAGIFWAIAVGLIAGRRWGLMLALFYMAEAVMSHLMFIVAYLNDRAEWYHVHLAATEGPFVVLLALYLWIRACDVIFTPAPRE